MEQSRMKFVISTSATENKGNHTDRKQVIMTKKAPIKVIKRSELNQRENNVVERTPQETARDMVVTVTNWVSEFQQKRRTETTQAIKNLFPESAQPSEA